MQAEKEIQALITTIYNLVHYSDFDPGHKCLLIETTMLLQHVNDYQFHDFKNTKLAAPKMGLDAMLEVLKDHLRAGQYDN